MNLYHMPQHSPEYWETRRGLPTASNFKHLISGAKKIKGVEPYSLKPTGSSSYIRELIAEVATLNPNYFTERSNISRNRATQHGQETEDEARQWLSMHLGREISRIGFITNDEESLGCSPDGLIRDETGRIIEGIELKCPQEKTQVEYLDARNEVPKEYLPQVHGSLIVTGLPRWHFCSYCPGLDPVHVIVERDWYTAKLEKVLQDFLAVYTPKLHEMFPGYAVVADWRKFLRDDPPVETFNARLPEMSAQPYAVKKRLWDMAETHAGKLGLVFDNAVKKFVKPVAWEDF